MQKNKLIQTTRKQIENERLDKRLRNGELLDEEIIQLRKEKEMKIKQQTNLDQQYFNAKYTRDMIDRQRKLNEKNLKQKQLDAVQLTFKPQIKKSKSKTPERLPVEERLIEQHRMREDFIKMKTNA